MSGTNFTNGEDLNNSGGHNTIKTFKMLKDEKQSQRLMAEYRQLKQSDLHNDRIKGFRRDSVQENLHKNEKQMLHPGGGSAIQKRKPS